jgi:hypothetical protein
LAGSVEPLKRPGDLEEQSRIARAEKTSRDFDRVAGIARVEP